MFYTYFAYLRIYFTFEAQFSIFFLLFMIITADLNKPDENGFFIFMFRPASKTTLYIFPPRIFLN